MPGIPDESQSLSQVPTDQEPLDPPVESVAMMTEVPTPADAELDQRYAAEDFMRAMGMEANPDAVDQLVGPFADALRIICTRDYDPSGAFWKLRGWKGLVHDIMDNAFRIRYFSWKQRKFYRNGALDIINFAGFYLRLENKGEPWGELGEPG